MLGPDKQLALTIEIGEASVRLVQFAPGRPVPPITIGTEGSWPMRAPGVKPVHVSVTFDGDVLYASGASGDVPVYVNGTPIDERWWPVTAPAELRFGAALLRLVVADANSRPSHAAPIGGSTMYVEPPAAVPPRDASASRAPAQPPPQAPERVAPAILGHTSLDAGGYWESRHASQRDDADAMNRTRLGPPSQSPGVVPQARNRSTPPPEAEQRYLPPQPPPQHEQRYAANRSAQPSERGPAERAPAPAAARLPSLVSSPREPEPPRAQQLAVDPQRYPSTAFQQQPAGYSPPAAAPFPPTPLSAQQMPPIEIHHVATGQAREPNPGAPGESPTAASLTGRRSPGDPPVMAATVVKPNYGVAAADAGNHRAPEMANTVPRPGFVPDGPPAAWPAPGQTPPPYAGYGASQTPPAQAPQPHWDAQQGAWPAPDASDPGDKPAEKSGLLGAWRSLSLPKKATAALVPAAFLLLLLPQPQEDAPTAASRSTASTAPAAKPEPGPGVAATSTVASSPNAAPTGTMNAGSRPGPSAAPKAATAGTAPPVASAAPPAAKPPAAKLDLKPGSDTPEEIEPLERSAIDAAFEGRWADALKSYEQLASTHPDQPAFREAARIIREKEQLPR